VKRISFRCFKGERVSVLTRQNIFLPFQGFGQPPKGIRKPHGWGSSQSANPGVNALVEKGNGQGDVKQFE